MADAEREQHARERLLLGAYELVHDFGCDSGAHLDGVARGYALLLVVLDVGAAGIERGDCIDVEQVEIGDIVQQARLDHLVDEFVAHAVHVHAAAAHPMDKALLELSGAVE